MPRLFTALDIPTPVATHLSFLQGGLPGARWIEPQNFHLTLRFIGDIEYSLAHELAQHLEQVLSEPFEFKLSGLDVFGHAKPHSLYVGVQRSEALLELQASIDRICRKLGLPPDPRKFTPHVTLARVRGIRPVEIAKYLSERGYFQSLEFQVNHFTLYSSRDSFGGGPYVCEETYTLVKKEEMRVTA